MNINLFLALWAVIVTSITKAVQIYPKVQTIGVICVGGERSSKCLLRMTVSHTFEKFHSWNGVYKSCYWFVHFVSHKLYINEHKMQCHQNEAGFCRDRDLSEALQPHEALNQWVIITSDMVY